MMQFPVVEVVKGNIHMLYSNDGAVREEAFSRLCWLLGTQKNSRDLLPRLSSLYSNNKSLMNACQLKRVVDLNNKTRNSHNINQHFYQVITNYIVVVVIIII